MFGRTVAALLAAALLGLACGCAPTSGHARGVEPPEIDVVLFVVDTLRADRLGTYGYAPARSPNIDALARSGVLFEQAYAPGPWTLPSVASLHTSTFMCEHGVLVDRQRVPESLETLAERMRRTGYETASFFTNPFAGSMTGLDRGFDVARRMHGTDAEDVAPWLDEVGERSTFLYVHNVEPHNPHDVPERYVDRVSLPVDAMMREAVRSAYATLRHLGRIDFVNEREVGTTDTTIFQRASLAFLDEIREPVSEMYDAQVSYADERIGGLIAELKRRGRWERTLFIVLADHGEELGDRGGWLHDHSVYEELVHVPLIVRFPGDAHAGRRISSVVSLVDVMPTLLNAIGRGELAAGARGRDLSELLEPGAVESETLLRVSSMRLNRKKHYEPWKALRGDDNLVVRQGDWKGIWNVERDAVELYDLATDPGETIDRAADEPALAAAMRDYAGRWLAECVERSPVGGEAGFDDSPLDPETLERLKSLGYL